MHGAFIRRRFTTKRSLQRHPVPLLPLPLRLDRLLHILLIHPTRLTQRPQQNLQLFVDLIAAVTAHALETSGFVEVGAVGDEVVDGGFRENGLDAKGSSASAASVGRETGVGIPCAPG